LSKSCGDPHGGAALGTVERAVGWWIGDWWAYGHRYDDRKAIVEAPGWTGSSFQTCMNAASVCRAFEPSRRREVLSFKHHAEVAALSPKEADEVLDECEQDDSVVDVRTKAKARKRAAREHRYGERSVVKHDDW
jgi:hypothetical protein